MLYTTHHTNATHILRMHTHTHIHTHIHTHTHTHTNYMCTHTQAHVGIGRNTVDVLKLLKFYMNETSFTVWESVITEVGHTSFLLGYTDFHDLFKKYALSLFESVGAKVGWDPKESDCEPCPCSAATPLLTTPTSTAPLDVLLRSMVLQQRGFYGDQSVVAEARKRFDDHLHGRKEIAADLKSVVYGIVAYHGDETTYTQLLEVGGGGRGALGVV